MKTEKALAIIAVIAAILKLTGLPLVTPILILSMSALYLIYFFGAFYFFSDGEIKRQNLILSIISGICLSIVPLGILFKLCWWPGASNMLFISLLTCLFFVALIYFLKGKSSEYLASYYDNMFKRTIVMCIGVTFFYFLPASTIIKIQHRNDPELVRLEIQSIENPNNKDYALQRENYAERRDSIRHLHR